MRQRAHGRIRHDTVDSAMVRRLYRFDRRHVHRVRRVHLCAHGARLVRDEDGIQLELGASSSVSE